MILGGVMAFVTLLPMNADAIFIDDPLEAPEGYVEFDDEGMLLWSFDVTSDSTHDDVYTAYRKQLENEERLLVYHSYKYNYTEFTVVNAGIETYDAIYSKYSEALGMDYHYRADPPVMQSDYDVTAIMCDMYDENGNETKDPSAMEDKSALIQEMVAEMYAAGCIKEAVYKSVVCNAVRGTYSGINAMLHTEDDAAEYDALQVIVSEFTDGEIKSYSEEYSCYYIDVELLESQELYTAIQEAYPDTTGSVVLYFLYTDGTVNTKEIDILAALRYQAADINADGTTDITDAVLILQHYAEGAASGVAAEFETNMDINGDSSVDLDDATEVLQIYAENAAGVSAS